MQNVSIEFLSIVVGTFSCAAWLTWFLREQFSKTHRMFYSVMSLHNREDDDRFEALSGDIQKIHLRNARIDGDEPPGRNPFPRRRYLNDPEAAMVPDRG